MAYFKGPKDKAQSCQVRVDLFKHDEEAMMMMKKMAEEVIEGKLAYEKDALYARRNQLLLEAGLRQAGVPTSEKKRLASSSSAKASTRKSNKTLAALSILGRSNYSFGESALAGMDTASCSM